MRASPARARIGQESWGSLRGIPTAPGAGLRQFPLAELGSVPFLAGAPVEDSHCGVHGQLQLGGHIGSRTDFSRGRPPNSGTYSK